VQLPAAFLRLGLGSMLFRKVEARARTRTTAGLEAGATVGERRYNFGPL
jgi:hypothetical protein